MKFQTMQLSVLSVFLVIPAVFGDSYDHDCKSDVGLCTSPQDLLHQYQPAIKVLKDEIATLYRSTADATTSTRNIIMKNIADARNITSIRMSEARHMLAQIKQETKDYPMPIQICISHQSLELGKILPPTLFECNSPSNFTHLSWVRAKIYKLNQAMLSLSNSCLLLNPLRSELTALKSCVNGKTADVKMQMVMVQKEFDKVGQEIMKYSMDCVLNGSSKVHEKIGIVLGAAKGCRLSGVAG